MAKPAVPPLETAPGTRPPHIRLAGESEIVGEGHNTLMDISVDDIEREKLLDSDYNARIQIRLQVKPADVLDTFLDFISRHADGRYLMPSLTNDGTLMMAFGVVDDSAASEELVRSFASDLARVLGRSDHDILEAVIIKMDDERLARALATTAIRRPDLQPV